MIRTRPTNAERAAYFHRAGTSVAQQVGRGATLTDRLITRVALAFYRAFVAVSEWRREHR